MRWRLHNASLTTQLVAMLSSVALVAAVLTCTFVALVVRVALADADPITVERAVRSVAFVTTAIAGCVGLAALGAGAYLRAAIGDRIEEMQVATAAIADGGFAHRINSERRDELGRLAHSIDDMASQLARLESSRRRMLAAVSHELRTPLTVIRGHAFTLGRTETDERRAAQFALIDAEVERLAALVAELLDASTLRAAPVQLQLETVAADQLMHAAAERFARAADARDLAIVVRAQPARVRVDRARIEQVLANLVANAVSHAPQGSAVMLDARLEAGKVRFGVRNAGRAIGAHELEVIFEPFVQGERRTGSVGLGLAIAKDLVDAHGSDLRVRSRPGATQFWFDLDVIGSPRPVAGRLRASAAARVQVAT